MIIQRNIRNTEEQAAQAEQKLNQQRQAHHNISQQSCKCSEGDTETGKYTQKGAVRHTQ